MHCRGASPPGLSRRHWELHLSPYLDPDIHQNSKAKFWSWNCCYTNTTPKTVKMAVLIIIIAIIIVVPLLSHCTLPSCNRHLGRMYSEDDGPGCDWLSVWTERCSEWICGSNKAAVDLQIVMSWCPPRHHPPCSSLLLMSEPPLLLFPSPPPPSPLSCSSVLFILSLSLVVSPCLGLPLSPLAPSQPGRVSELTSQSTASENQSLAWHDM